MIRVLKILTFLVYSFFLSYSYASEDLSREILDSWEKKRDTTITESARKSIIDEANTAVERIKNDEILASAYTDEDLGIALSNYLDNQLYLGESPLLLSILVEEVSPRGTVASFSARYPKLVLNTNFDLNMILLNFDPVYFQKPKRSITLLLNVGDNNIQVTDRPSSVNCEFNIEAERGRTYEIQCP